ncbi:glutathione binding-like protein [Methylocella tundrae]|uniref:Disulfide-bond oxidoreductase YfcG n=1 Tax=Methylocella tundrae TaxID=227605 RepID=A0A4U8Z2K7_METTU|nr:glutathione S-transferase C-terminal domain-containing protein [Methylocella tundrae]WPP03469.1 glutathione binding-like protein [Methylocella tundrae]VFU09558.1 Disulfide-bond oxidoreductase YfcG [Methylocella tundrae]
MITLYSWATPSGHIVSIMLEEIGTPYDVRTVNISKREQFHPTFLAVSPNAKIPAIVDDGAADGPLAIFESGAILLYLAEKSGRLLPPSGADRAKTFEWLFWATAGLAPTLAEFGHFAIFAKRKTPVAIDRLSAEADRLLRVLDRRLAETPYLAGEHYSIADIAAYPWAAGASVLVREHLNAAPRVRDWLERLSARPAVQRGMAAPLLPARAARASRRSFNNP